MASMGDTWRLGRRPAEVLCWLLPATACAFWIAYFFPRGANDWLISRAAGDLLINGHFDVYARMPEAQMGPLALLLSGGLPTPVYLLVVAGMFAVTLWCIVSAFGNRTVVLVGGVLASWPWAIYALEGHADDALVATAAAGMVAAYRRGNPMLATVAFLVGVTGKPTALMFLPLVFLTSRRAGVVALVAGGLFWAPFALADLHGFLSAGGGVVDTNAGSVPNLLGSPVGDAYPIWLRPAMLATAMLACWFVGRRNVAAAVVWVCVIRALFEPGGYTSYTVAVLVAAIAVDAAARRVAPLTVLLVLPVWWMGFHYWPLSPNEGWARAVVLAGAAVLAWLSGRGHGVEVRRRLPGGVLSREPSRRELTVP